MTNFGFETTSDEAATALSSYIQGRTVIITGVTEGSLGADIARALAPHMPAILILASRSKEKIMKVVNRIQFSSETKVQVLELDLASLASVRAAAEKILDWTTSVDAIMETAGVMAVPDFTKTEDGVEMQFAVNHLGHFLLTNLIMPRLLASQTGGRVVPFTSAGHKQAVLNLEDVNFKNGEYYNKWWAYGSSKGCNILFALGLDQRFGNRGLRSFAVDPGVIVGTGLSRNVEKTEFIELGWLNPDGSAPAGFIQKSAAQGAATGIVAAFDPALADQKGSVMEGGTVNNGMAAPYALERSNIDKLWELSEELVDQHFM
ncbi:hypothetical protein H2198_005614 [Neophaeococcomyces mojaviensis]|uniref:Uncharacterized protein n=1 Tax=Neophaeococcomyces mojaviensis TaxID=3383035 RepID=A0ACC3A5E9_9EURO|nr:hypothetical protein H2198_005614 [Knufia sp. JES_112]